MQARRIGGGEDMNVIRTEVAAGMGYRLESRGSRAREKQPSCCPEMIRRMGTNLCDTYDCMCWLHNIRREMAV